MQLSYISAPARVLQRARSTTNQALRRSVRSLLDSRLVSAACAPHDVNAYLALFDRAWSTREVRARVVGVHQEEGGTISLRMRPNDLWRGFRPGQYVSIAVSVGGVRTVRCFSLSSAPHDPTLTITVKQRPDGRVSRWITDVARAGHVVELSQALGDFVLPEPPPARLLMIAGGSGITPFRSMLLHLEQSGYAGEVTCLHYAPGAATFGDELSALASRMPGLRYVHVRNPAVGTPIETLSEATLDARVPWWRDAEVYVCGPDALRDAALTVLDEAGRADHVHFERFVAASIAPRADVPNAPRRLVFARTGRAVEGTAGQNLLEQAEHAGLRPAHGCRMGICHTCKCTKLTGVVRNQLTGELSGAEAEEVRLCISTPESDVTLAL